MMLCAEVAPTEGLKLPSPIPPQTFPLYSKAPIGDGTFEEAVDLNLNIPASVTLYRPAKPNGAIVVICPGGGYGKVGMAGEEGALRAKWFNDLGVTGVVLNYRLPKGRSKVPLLDVQRAIRLVRSKATEWGCDPHRVGVLGFSAGGHVASMAATHYDKGNPQAADAVDRQSCRPDFALLVYPVITMGAQAHGGSRTNLLGPHPSEELVKLYSNELQVTDDTPPCFLAHAKDDSMVVPDNSRTFYAALQAHKVPSHYLELPSGGHGLNGYKGPNWDAWLAEAIQWMREQKIIPGQS